MRQAAFGIEELYSLVQAAAVAAISVDALESKSTGQVFDVRLPKNDPFMTDAGAAALP
jgi:hypothetical protein